MTTYAELRLRIDRGVSNRSYRIVATGPAGEALGRFKLPFSDLELENFVLRVGRTRRGTRRIESPEMELAKDFGAKLFGALFEGDVRELYRSSFAETRSAGQGLRVTLSLTSSPELLQVPWEYLYDHPSFLSISSWTPIVRYLDLPRPRRPIRIGLPLRILGIVSAPNDAESIDANQERAKLEAALKPLIEAGSIAIDWLEEASLRALQRQLRRGEYHVLHYIGHGGYDHDADDGVLLFEDEHGRGRKVSGVQLGTILADEVSLRLAVLNSCEGGRTSLEDPFSGVATSLIEREIPAVIGMQFEITDRAAIIFAAEFYSALADGLPVDSAVAEARKAIYADENDIEWGTPVLFMRVADGRLFDVEAKGTTPSVAAVAPVADVIDDEVFERERLAAIEAERAELERAEAERAESERAERERRRAEVEAELEQLRLAAAAEAAVAAEVAATADVPAIDPPAATAPVLPLAAIDVASVAAASPGGSVAGSSGEDARTSAEAVRGIAPATSSTSRVDDSPAAQPTNLIRPAVRGALGGALMVVLLMVAWLVGHWSDLFDGDFPFYVVEAAVGFGILMTFGMAAGATLAEGVSPKLRVPEGDAYRRVANNPLAAAAIQGAGIGLVVGSTGALLAAGNMYLQIIDIFLWIPVFTGAAFALVEAARRRWSARRDRRARSDPAD